MQMHEPAGFLFLISMSSNQCNLQAKPWKMIEVRVDFLFPFQNFSIYSFWKVCYHILAHNEEVQSLQHLIEKLNLLPKVGVFLVAKNQYNWASCWDSKASNIGNNIWDILCHHVMIFFVNIIAIISVITHSLIFCPFAKMAFVPYGLLNDK